MIKDGLLHGRICTQWVLLINYVSEYEPKNFCFIFPRYLMELRSPISIHLDQTEHRTNINEHTVLFRNLRLL